MKLDKLHIHHLRSVENAVINLTNYSMLIGENNAGKTNIIYALRLFYEDSIKFSEDVDFPKFDTEDKESWIELSFSTTDDEQSNLREEYRSTDNILRVRKYFLSDNGLAKSGQSNIYAYEDGKLSSNLFYGTKNVSQTKFGKVIYIPAVHKAEDAVKTTGPSPFRGMLNWVMEKAILDSSTFHELRKAFNTFNTDFKNESSKEGFSIDSLMDDINNEIDNWNVKFGISINPIKPEDIVKNLLSHHIEDIGLDGKQINLSSFGQGLQRHLIFTLIKLSPKYTTRKLVTKKEFDPEFTLILFEEPEAFLHPSQQQVLHLRLKSLSEKGSEQILTSSHSPHFVSRKISQIAGIIRLHKKNKITTTHQLTDERYRCLLDGNIGLYKLFCKYLAESDDEGLKKKIKKNHLGDDPPDESTKLGEEALKFFLWLDSERASMFFAKKVIICEGASEKIYLDYLCDEDEEWTHKRDEHIYFLDSLGKFNIHRYIALLTALGVPHSVLMDGDGENQIQGIVNSFIDKRKTDFTIDIHIFDEDLEEFLEIKKSKRSDLKPLNIIYRHQQGEISREKVKALKKIIDSL